MVYQDRIETNSLQSFAQQENSEWFLIISVIILRWVLLLNRNKITGNDLLIFYKFPFPSTFILLPLPYRFSACLKRSISEKEALLPTKRIFWNQCPLLSYKNAQYHPVACRGLVMPGATAWLDAPLPSSSIEQWRMVVIVTGYTLFVTSYSRAICFGEVCWHNVQIQGRRNSDRAGGTVKELRAMESYKKQKNRYQLCLLLFINCVDLKNNITEIIENHSEFSGCPKSCNKFV